MQKNKGSKNNFKRYIYALLCLCLVVSRVSGQALLQGQPELYTDFLYTDHKEIFIDVYYTAPASGKVKLVLNGYYYKSAGDSMRVFSTTVKEQALKKGKGKIKLPFSKTLNEVYLLPSFATVLRKTALIPPGSYRVFIQATGSGDVYEKVLNRETDSALAFNSLLRKDINTMLVPGGRSFWGDKAPLKGMQDNAGFAFTRFRPRLDRYFRKKGLAPVHHSSGGKEIIDLYCEDWYMGRYEMNSNASLTAQLEKQKNGLEQNIGDMTRNQLNNYQSLLSQFRELKKNSHENKELQGELAVTANFSNDQEQFSNQDNNYYEVRGNLELPIFDIPVSVSGYYTTQDKKREAKASFIHFRYDAEKAKEQLLKLISAYNKRYEQTIASGGNYEMIYGQFLQQVSTEKDKAIAALKQEYGLNRFDPATFDPETLKTQAQQLAAAQLDKAKDSLTDAATSAAGNSAGKALAGAEKAKAAATDQYAKAMAQYEKIMELERKLKKYQVMLDQYRQTLHFDSLMAYDKLKDIRNADRMSYKDLAKSASGILPEGKAKSAVAGLVNLDAGMFPKYVSDYTMSGQMLKGIDVGYDVGAAEIGATYGKTEYIDRTGNVESYKAYSGRVMFKPLFHQRVGFVYYGYSPGRQLLSDNNFFKATDVSLPSFRNPVHILSATYEGTLTKYVLLTGTYAFSQKQGQSEAAAGTLSLKDRSAYNINLTGSVPGMPVEVEAAYEYGGKAFENNTLPVTMAGTEKIRLKGKGDLFQSFLSLGIEYNYMIQRSFNVKGSNARWGFDVATHSKRFPSVSLSYKPFATFRSFNDTLNIEQKPIQGEVWTGRINYQIKKKDRAVRFVLLYNKNTSTMDTVQYGSSLLQFSTILSRKTTMLSLNTGVNKINTDYVQTAFPAFNNATFLNVSAGTSLDRSISVNGGVDLAASKIGLSRYGVFSGLAYTFRKLPFMVRTNFRFSNYKLDETLAWKQLYSGSIELAWRFRVKLFDAD